MAGAWEVVRRRIERILRSVASCSMAGRGEAVHGGGEVGWWWSGVSQEGRRDCDSSSSSSGSSSSSRVCTSHQKWKRPANNRLVRDGPSYGATCKVQHIPGM